MFLIGKIHCQVKGVHFPAIAIVSLTECKTQEKVMIFVEAIFFRV